MSITIEYISQMRETLLAFHEKTGRLIHACGSDPAAESQAMTEQAGYPRPESVVSAFTLGTLLIEHGAEHLTAFVKNGNRTSRGHRRC